MSDFSGITAALLAGGLGTRLRSVVSDRQKVVAEVQGRPFLMFLLDQLADVGVQRVVVCTGHHAEQVAELLGDAHRGMQLLYSPEDQPLGTAGALRHALPCLDSENLLILNGDSFCDADLRGLLTDFLAHDSLGSIVVTRVADTRRYGRVAFDEAGRIEAFIEKGEAGGPGWINSGIYLLPRALIASFPAGQAASLERDGFPVWLQRGLWAFSSEGDFIDIGTPESYAAATRFFAGKVKA